MAHSVVVLGGGISGLAAAWALQTRYGKEVEVTLLEASERLGGWIQTQHDEGFLFEAGPRSCRASGAGAHTLCLIEELGLQDQVISAQRSAHKRYIYTRGHLQLVPQGPISFLRSPLTRPLVWPLLREWRVPPGQSDDETIYTFIERRLGAYAAETLVDPMVSGIYAGNTRHLSVKACFPTLFNWERQKGSLVKGAFSRNEAGNEPDTPFIRSVRKQGSLFSLRQGMEQLIHALEAQLDAKIIKGTRAWNLHCHENGVEVVCSNGEKFAADYLISALPAPALGSLFADSDPTLTELLGEIPLTSVAVVNIGYRQRVLNQEGFGYLIPSRESERVLGVVWDSCIFAEHSSSPEQQRFTVMIGGEHMPDFSAYGVRDFEIMARDALARHLGIEVDPDYVQVHAARGSIPQYTLGHAARVAQIKKRLESLSSRISLLGNCFDGISVNESIANAQKVVASLTLASMACR